MDRVARITDSGRADPVDDAEFIDGEVIKMDGGYKLTQEESNP